ncbi:hypothetical protein PoB_002144800 [Plakobranchus ocellatus]|uniref:Secreted protein n=1 Tax=Plakobranchus ocellatus TaxID=259542 RepID=A0AAV3ZKB5_9GAST|nr:hypothetical protein PoB_002144800 [Plakobranchus ocellatus]
MLPLLCATHRQVSPIFCVTRLASWFAAATVSSIMRGHVMASPFPLSNRATDVTSGCKTQRIAPTLRQVADLVCARTREREYFKTCIVGHVNCCLQCGPTLKLCSNISECKNMPFGAASLWWTIAMARNAGSQRSCGLTLTATSVLQVSYDKSRRLQCGSTLTILYPTISKPDNMLYPTISKPDNLRNKTGLVVREARISRIMCNHVMALVVG